MNNTPLVIEATGIKKIYNKGLPNAVHALRGIDLEVKKGEIVAIMGPSGSGKTTLLNCLSGIDYASEGVIKLAGLDCQLMNDRVKTAFRAKEMGFVFQSFNLIPILSAIENVEIPLLLNGMKPSEARKRASVMLDQVGLSDRKDHLPGELSGGQRQRVTIARALIHSPSVIWADEPTGSLDSEATREILNLITDRNRAYGETFVLVTHDPQVAAYASRTILMENGAVKDVTVSTKC